MNLHDAKASLETDASGKPVDIPVYHRTTVASAQGILKDGFSLKYAGRTKKKTGWQGPEAKGIYFSILKGDDLKSRPAHMWQHDQRGTYVVATAHLKNPLRATSITIQNQLKDEHGVDGLALTKKLQKLGYDGIVTPVEVVVFDPKNITVDRDQTAKIMARHLYDQMEPTWLSGPYHGSKPTRAQVADMIRKLIGEFKQDPRSINSGDCDLFAQELVSRLDYGEAEELLNDDDEDDSFPNHAWAVIDGRYYDAEAPDGVEHWWDLPIFKRWATRDLSESAKTTVAMADEEDLRNMHPDAQPNTAVVKLPYVTGGTWYHGRGLKPRGKLTFDPKRPTFFTRHKDDAEWFAGNRFDTGEDPTVVTARIHSKKPARYRDLLDAVRATKSGEDDISENSPYDGTNDTDYLYVPKVIEALKKAGFDCYFGLDPFENNEIIIVVPFNTRDIEVTSVETTEKFE